MVTKCISFSGPPANRLHVVSLTWVLRVNALPEDETDAALVGINTSGIRFYLLVMMVSCQISSFP